MINPQIIPLVLRQADKVKFNLPLIKDEMLMKKILNWIWIFVLPVFFACNNTRHIPKGDALYTGARVKLGGTDGLGPKERKVLRADLDGLTRPKPNTKILGLRVSLAIYNLAGDTSKKGFIRKFLRKLGQPPVLLSSLNLEKNVSILQNHMENTGFFRGEVTGDTIVKRKRARAIYEASAGPQYTIKEVQFIPDSSDRADSVGLFTQVRASSSETLLVPGAPFNLALIKAERMRIDAYLKERGYYFFNPDFLIVQVDSTIGEHKVNMYVNLKPSTPPESFDVYRISDVYVYSNYSLNTASIDTNMAKAQFYKGYYVIDPERKFKPKLFEQALKFNPGDVYNRTDHNLSLNRLVNLNLYKFVKNRFEVTPAVDSPSLDVYYYLTPLPRRSLSAQVTGSTKSNNLTGTEITFSWRNRNAFRGGELLVVNASVGSEVQYGGPLQGFNTFSTGLSTILAFPRFIVPFMHFNNRSGYVPRTGISLSYDILNKQKLYTLNSFRGDFGYMWKEDMRKEHRLNPISVTYVIPADVTQLYADSVAKHPSLGKAIERQFILGSTYSYNYNQLINAQPVNAIYFNGVVDLSGNVAGLIVPVAKDTNTKQIFNEDFAQYVKLESDLRYYRKIGLRMTWANRIITGFGYPYGNSKELPFIKQFFAGGNNSIRAFRSRSIGPGTFKDTLNKDFLPDQTGDIKLELNTELRMKFSRILEGAVFIDAGNIWLYRKNPYKPGAEFSKDFLKQLAVGTGAGIRLDFSFFLIRLDVAFPLRKPFLVGNEWVIDQIDFTNKSWRGDNIIYNLAIGYPF